MKRLINYSHALSPAAKAQLREAVGDFKEIVIPVQLDFDQPLVPQLEALVAEAGNVAPDLYIPPALSFAAAYVTAALSRAQSDGERPQMPTMVVLKREGTPPQFVLAEVIETSVSIG